MHCSLYIWFAFRSHDSYLKFTRLLDRLNGTVYHCSLVLEPSSITSTSTDRKKNGKCTGTRKKNNKSCYFRHFFQYFLFCWQSEPGCRVVSVATTRHLVKTFSTAKTADEGFTNIRLPARLYMSPDFSQSSACVDQSVFSGTETLRMQTGMKWRYVETALSAPVEPMKNTL